MPKPLEYVSHAFRANSFWSKERVVVSLESFDCGLVSFVNFKSQDLLIAYNFSVIFVLEF